MCAEGTLQPVLTVDCVLFGRAGSVLLVRRSRSPFQGTWALPGGKIDYGETVETACRREVREETGLDIRDLRLVGVYSDPARDPRGHFISVVFLGSVDLAADPRAGSDAAAVEFVSDWRSVPIAFDHRQIIEDAERLRDFGATARAD